MTAPRLSPTALAAACAGDLVMAARLTARAARPSQVPVELLQLTVLRRLDGLLQGDHAGLLPGHGSETGEARPYVPATTPAASTGRVTARTADPHVRDTIADHELELWLRGRRLGQPGLRHRRAARSTRWPGPPPAPSPCSASRGGNRVGCHHRRRPAHDLPARSGRAPRRRGPGRRCAATPEDGASADLAARPDRRCAASPAAAAWSSWSPTSSMPDGWERPLRALAAGTTWSPSRSSTRASWTLPDVGLLTVVDPETGRRRFVDTGDATVCATATPRPQPASGPTIARRLAAAGADHLVLRTDRDWVVDLVRFVGAARPAAWPLRPALMAPTPSPPWELVADALPSPSSPPPACGCCSCRSCCWSPTSCRSSAGARYAVRFTNVDLLD